MKKYVLKNIALFSSLSIVAMPLISCETSTKVFTAKNTITKNPTQTNIKPNKEKITLYNQNKIPSSLLGGKLQLAPTEFDQIRMERIKNLKITKDGNNYVIKTDTDNFYFPSDIFNWKLSFITKEEDLLRIARKYLYSINSIQGLKANFHFQNNAGVSGLYDATDHNISIHLNEQKYVQNEIVATMLHEKYHDVFEYFGGMKKTKKLGDDIFKHDQDFNKIWDPYSNYAPTAPTNIFSKEEINKFYDFPILEFSGSKYFPSQYLGRIYNSSSFTSKKSQGNSYKNELLAEMLTEFSGIQKLLLNDKSRIKRKLDNREIMYPIPLKASSTGAWVGYKIFDTNNYNKPLYMMTSVLNNLYDINDKANIRFKKIRPKYGIASKKSELGFSLYGTKGKGAKNLTFTWGNNQTKVVPIKHKRVAYGFHGRPWDSEYDYKYVTDLAYVDPIFFPALSFKDEQTLKIKINGISINQNDININFID